MNDALSNLVSTLQQWEWVTEEQLLGCTNEEIAALEEQFAVSLPATYKEFLTVMGKGAGRFERDASWKYHALKHAREEAEHLLADIERIRGEEEEEQDNDENADSTDASPKTLKPLVPLKPTDFVFLCGSYNFLYFDTTKGDNPPVQLIEESEDEPNTTFPSFTNWLEVVAHYVAKNSKILKDRKAELKAMGIGGD